ncbi:glycosyltransferase family 2 protein, partial [Paenibacillus sp. y28]|uniref:glycosyltransferase family 2 protein n=1 Tax=Paenibacillus sp. y28 TaxID=3129110 RepID=UPI00301846CC
LRISCTRLIGLFFMCRFSTRTFHCPDLIAGEKMDLSIVMVNYNTTNLTRNALNSIYASQTIFSYEVYLVDNNSPDRSIEEIRFEFPQVVFIQNEQNVGFARANNQAIRLSQGTYILLLNSDTEINVDTLQIVISYMQENHDVGAVGCKIVLPDGSLDKACKRGFPTPSAAFFYASRIYKLFPNKPRYNQYQLGHLNPDKVHSVDSLVGAFMLVRKKVVEQVGYLDEQFFMYGDDLDWCYRIKKDGWKIIYYPKTTILHYKSASSKNKSYKIIYEFHRAMFLFYRKHYRRKYPWFVTGFVYIGIFANMVLGMITRRFMQT